MTAFQRAMYWCEHCMNNECEWICEEQGERIASSLSRISCVKGKGINARAAYFYLTNRSIAALSKFGSAFLLDYIPDVSISRC